MKPRTAMHIFCAAVVSTAATSCLEPPAAPTPQAVVARMTPQEKVAVVKKALAASNTDPQAVQPAEIDWKLELAEMKGVLRPTDGESYALEIAFENRDQEIGRWMKSEKYARMLSLEQQLRELSAAMDQKGIDEAKKELQPLRDELKQLVEKHRVRILETLSQSSRSKWFVHRLTEQMRILMSPLKLTDEQITELRSRAWNNVEQVATSRQISDVQAAAFVQLETEMEKEVLRRDQRRTYQTVKQDNPQRSEF